MSYLLNENYIKILEYIANKKEFTEKEIKKELKIKEDEIRKLLYILEENGVVYPINIINNNGKFDFRWGNKIVGEKELFSFLVKKEIDKFKKELEKTPRTVYYCEECAIGYTFEEAEENDFKCKECGSLLVEKENFRIFELENIINNLQSLLEKYTKEAKEKKVAKAKGKK
jgi:transcription initiation factor TFIIE subunit alpha